MGNSDDGYASSADDFQTSGGYIYVILIIALVIAIVYFSKVILTKRREKKRLSKEQDCEVPPGYFNHVLDIQVYDGDSGHFPSSETLVPITTVRSVQPPARALTRTPRSSADPPAYEDLLGPPNVHRSPSSTSIVSDSTAAMEEQNGAASNSRTQYISLTRHTNPFPQIQMTHV
ncbi:hypothetical protein BGZ58_011275 [Dissophora ornata]|nr:hypothetical protein BGZ58_011275 [Dissophora ornata]